MSAEVRIAPITHRLWGQLASGEVHPPYRCLALKLMMIRIRHDYERRPETRAELAAEVRRFFVANMRFAEADYRAIFEEFVA